MVLRLGLAKHIAQTRVGQVDVGVDQRVGLANMNCHLDAVRLAKEEGLAEDIQKTRVDALRLVGFANVMVLRNMMNHQLEDVRLAEEGLAEGIQIRVDAL